MSDKHKGVGALQSAAIEDLAQRRLAESRHYARHFKNVTVRYDDGALMLLGRLPSYYLKQILQTLLRDLEGVERIHNRVEVEPSTVFRQFTVTADAEAVGGLRGIQNAGAILSDRGTSLSKRLLNAGREFLSATQFEHDWPSELRWSAKRIRIRLLASGDIASSIRTMDEGSFDETAEELLLFVKAANQLAALSRSSRLGTQSREARCRRQSSRRDNQSRHTEHESGKQFAAVG